MTSSRSDLIAAAQDFALVRLRRSRLDGDVYHYGCVAEASREIVVLHRFSDRLDLDGYDVFRAQDVTTCQLDFPNRRLYDRVFKIKQLKPVRPGDKPLATLRNTIAFANQEFGLIVLYREDAISDECVIGSVAAQTATGVRLRLLTPAGEWVPAEQHYLYSSISRLSFGAEYENTLSRVVFEASMS